MLFNYLKLYSLYIPILLVKQMAHYKSYQRENGEFTDYIVSGNVSPQKQVGDIKLI